MNEDENDINFTKWFSTYGLLTAERVLLQFQVRLSHDALISIVKTTNSLYHLLLKIPTQNIFNGIILQQARDYQIFAQKKMIDYLISGEAEKTEDMPGASIRESLSQEQDLINTMNTEFDSLCLEHQKWIANCQTQFITFSKQINQALMGCAKILSQSFQNNKYTTAKLFKVLQQSLAKTSDIEVDLFNDHTTFWTNVCEELEIELVSIRLNEMQPFLESIIKELAALKVANQTLVEPTRDMGILIRDFRTRFYELILRVKELISHLPEYRVDEVLEAQKLESIQFNTEIGE